MLHKEISGQIIDAAIRVHSKLGPGLLESAYHLCLLHELRARGLRVRSQIPVPVDYDGIRIHTGYRMDLLVEECVLVELKAVARMLPLYRSQALSYLRLSGHRVGLLLNFHVLHMRDGITRIVN